MRIHRLSAKEVHNLRQPGRYGDGGGLWLQVAPGGGKSWLLRFHWNKREKVMGLGSIATVTLAEAREKAREARKQVAAGVDPLEQKRARDAARALETLRIITFKECAESYMADRADSWRNSKHRAQWHSTLACYAYPVLGDIPVADIDKALVLKVLQPIWRDKAETASRIRMRIEAVLNWAAALGHRSGENPARWRGHLDMLLPSRRNVRKVVHHPALPYRQIPAFMLQLRDQRGNAARCLEFLILCACRTGEAIGARPTEFDLERKTWTIPAERMKANREHRVALSDRAVEIVKSLIGGGDYVFTGGRGGRSLSSAAMAALLVRMKREDITVHGFRSTFRDWAAEQTAYSPEVAEMALAHTIGDKTEAAYRRGDLLEKRFKLSGDWAQYCESHPADLADVVPIRLAAAE